MPASTWLPTDQTTERKGMRLWARILQVVVLHVSLAIGVWWGLNPDLANSSARPFEYPAFLTAVTAVLVFLVLGQASARLPIALGAAIVIAGIAVGPVTVQAADQLSASFDAQRVDAARVVAAHELSNGMWQADYGLPDGRVERGFFTLQDHSQHYRRRPGDWLYFNNGPFAHPGDQVDVVVDRHGLVVTHDAGGAQTSTGRTVALVWGGVAALLLGLVELAAVTSLVRRTSLLQRYGDDSGEESVPA